jgi:hypothetical protein
VANLGRPGLSAARKKELWDRWKAGESISDIARALEKPPGSIHGVLKATGGIAPPQRCRPKGGRSFWLSGRRSLGVLRPESLDALYRGPLGPICLEYKPGDRP